MAEEFALPDFDTEKARQEYIIKNAKYFTTIRRENRAYVREEHKTLEAAKAYAEGEVDKNPHLRFLIYAILGNSDTYVMTVGK